MEIVCTLEKGTLPTPETLTVKPVVVLELELDEFEFDPEVEEPVEPEPPMLTLSTVPLT